MGLRIIDRKRSTSVPTRPLSEAEVLTTLQDTAKSWPYGRIAKELSAESEFIEKYKRIRKNFDNKTDILDMASKIEAKIRQAYVSETRCHSRVDIATLLQLL